eukprot:jgi/Mesvir1/13263/Mv08125-RA.1
MASMVASFRDLPLCPLEPIPTQSQAVTCRTVIARHYLLPAGVSHASTTINKHRCITRTQLGVHIADVSFFVGQESLLDYEARARATTVYLIGKRFDMLPSVLSENLCSLLGNVDRLAVSVLWTVDPSRDFAVVATWFGRTLIHSGHQVRRTPCAREAGGSDR